MAKFYKKPHSALDIEAKLNGEVCMVGVNKPKVVSEFVQLASTCGELDRLRKANKDQISVQEIEIMIGVLTERVAYVKGITDEDGQEVVWQDLDLSDKRFLLDQMDIASLNDLFIAAVSIDIVTEDEKKVSQS